MTKGSVALLALEVTGIALMFVATIVKEVPLAIFGAALYIGTAIEKRS